MRRFFALFSGTLPVVKSFAGNSLRSSWLHGMEESRRFDPDQVHQHLPPNVAFAPNHRLISTDQLTTLPVVCGVRRG